MYIMMLLNYIHIQILTRLLIDMKNARSSKSINIGSIQDPTKHDASIIW